MAVALTMKFKMENVMLCRVQHKGGTIVEYSITDMINEFLWTETFSLQLYQENN